MAEAPSRSAAFPWLDGRPTHLPCGPGDLPPIVLLPGDPDRVPIAAGILDDVVELGQRREFRVARGTWEGVPIGICSTGIGGPSTEIAVVELAHLGIRTALRVGGMGALLPELGLGSFVAVERACGGTGTRQAYAPGTEALPADPGLLAALDEAASRLGLPCARGTIRTTDSYYRGQGRATRPDALAPPTAMADLAHGGIAGLDMECEALFAVGRSLGLRVGAVLAVHGNRATDAWLEDYEGTQRDLIRLAACAAAGLDPSVSRTAGA